jgi:ParB/RepB/Spo0J family partition protein
MDTFTEPLTAAAATGYTTLLLDQLVPSLTNPRKFFNPLKLEELANSIKRSGVHQPILVRKLPPSRLQETFAGRRRGAPLPTHEIVAGERRYRASQMAGQPTIPVLIKDLSDGDALELQIVENLQRDDLTPLEEAEGYKTLMEHTFINADDIGAKIGKSRSYVYGRLKLLELACDSATALREGRIDATTALLIARVPDSKLQAKALAYATTSTGQFSDSRPSGRAFKSWLQQNVMLDLGAAWFPIDNATLVPNAGPCQLCPQRTGHDPDLFADVDSPDLCTNPTCYNQKTSAWHDIKIKQAAESGMEFVTGKQSLEIFDRKYQPEHMRGYTDLRELVELTDGREVTVAEAIGKNIPGVMLLENPHTHRLVEAAPTEEIQAILLARGLLANSGTEAATKLAISMKTHELGVLKSKVEDRIASAQSNARWQAVAEALCESHRSSIYGIGECAPFSRNLVLAMCLWVEDTCDVLGTPEARRMQLGPQEEDDTEFEFAGKLAELSDSELSLVLKKMILLEDRPRRWASETGPFTEALAADLEVDFEAIDAQIKAQTKKEVEAEIKATQKELNALKAANEQKHLPPTTPLAQPLNAGGGGEGEGPKEKKPRAKSAPLRKPKMREEEALSGIATAMQGDNASADLQTADTPRVGRIVSEEEWPFPKADS